MNAILAAARMDFRMVMVYKKSYWTFLIIPFIFIFSFQDTVGILICATVMGVVGMYYPFSIEEASSMSRRVLSMPVSRRELVWGRYLYTIAVMALFLLVIVAEICIMFPLLHRPLIFSDIMLSYFLALGLVSVFASLQLPVYYKFGYLRAGNLTSAVFLCLWVLVFVGSGFIARRYSDSLIARTVSALLSSSVLSEIIFAIVVLVILVTSCLISVSIYRKKEA